MRQIMSHERSHIPKFINKVLSWVDYSLRGYLFLCTYPPTNASLGDKSPGPQISTPHQILNDAASETCYYHSHGARVAIKIEQFSGEQILWTSGGSWKQCSANRIWGTK